MQQQGEALRKVEQALESVRFVNSSAAELVALKGDLAPLWERAEALQKALAPYREIQRQLEELWTTVSELEKRLEPMQALQAELTAIKEALRAATRHALP